MISSQWFEDKDDHDVPVEELLMMAQNTLLADTKFLSLKNLYQLAKSNQDSYNQFVDSWGDYYKEIFEATVKREEEIDKQLFNASVHICDGTILSHAKEAKSKAKWMELKGEVEHAKTTNHVHPALLKELVHQCS